MYGSNVPEHSNVPLQILNDVDGDIDNDIDVDDESEKLDCSN